MDQVIEARRDCPFCAETIPVDVSTCEHCSSNLQPAQLTSVTSERFCTNCGSEVNVNAAVCTKCGAHPRPHKKFCYGCGCGLNPEQIVCIKCGASLPQGVANTAQPATVAKSYCTNCGNAVDKNAVACTSCGAAPRSHRKFCSNCSVGLNAEQVICLKCGVNIGRPTAAASVGSSEKKKTTAGILALILGSVGVHKFYLGSWGWGIVYLTLFWTYIPAIIGFIEGIILLTMNQAKFDSKYNDEPSSPFKW